jgi:hypothetical protein
MFAATVIDIETDFRHATETSAEFRRRMAPPRRRRRLRHLLAL